MEFKEIKKSRNSTRTLILYHPHPSPSIFTSACNSLVISLISEISPITIRRSEEFYLSSKIEFHCNDFDSIVLKWKIYDSSKIEFNIPTIEQTYSDLFIPSLTLTYGFYELKLMATMIPSSTTIESKSLFVQIIPSDITVKLIQSNTSLITYRQGQDLKLDPGRYSIDHDGYPFNTTVSSMNNRSIYL